MLTPWALFFSSVSLIHLLESRTPLRIWWNLSIDPLPREVHVNTELYTQLPGSWAPHKSPLGSSQRKWTRGQGLPHKSMSAASALYLWAGDSAQELILGERGGRKKRTKRKEKRKSKKRSSASRNSKTLKNPVFRWTLKWTKCNRIKFHVIKENVMQHFKSF